MTNFAIRRFDNQVHSSAQQNEDGCYEGAKWGSGSE